MGVQWSMALIEPCLAINARRHFYGIEPNPGDFQNIFKVPLECEVQTSTSIVSALES